jgi:DNA modification methylase
MTEGLSEQERKSIAEIILSGGKIPKKFAPSVLEGSKELELTWTGKSDIVEQVVLPFQSIEQIDEPRQSESAALTLFDFDVTSGRQVGGWSNKLIWGDNKLILSSLSRGPVRQQIEDAGGLKLVYIDPPFDVGYDFSMEVSVGDESISKEPSVLEQFAYRDTWGKGTDSFASMIYERLQLIRDLLAPDGSVFVHCDWRTSHIIRLIMDEVFGSENFRNELIWRYSGWNKKLDGFFERRHDVILFYSKSENSIFNSATEPWESVEQYVKVRKQKLHTDENGKQYVISDAGGGRRVNRYIDEAMEYGRPLDDVWILDKMNNSSKESVGYPTQKPEALISRIIESASNPGDLVADFFCGSGTTLSVAEKLDRKWIGADLGRFAIHTSRKRLISVQRERKEKGLSYRSFEILNLGGYERQYFLGDSSTETNSESLAKKRRSDFVNLVLAAYEGQVSSQLPPFSGSKNQTAVFVGEVNAAVTQSDVEECIESALNSGITKIDILGFEFEMGISPVLADSAKEKGLTLTLRYIPSEVFDMRAVKSGAVQFYEVGYLEINPTVKDLDVRVTLTDFGVFYRQTDADEAAAALKPGSSKAVVDQGQVLLISKSKSGEISRENVTSKWEDWIDYWSIDFNFESNPEIVRIVDGSGESEKATGRFVFENEWQSFRTPSDRTLELQSAWHTYEHPGTYSVAVKVIDIFGNDTTRVFKVKVG